jgi:hypothetical protein
MDLLTEIARQADVAVVVDPYAVIFAPRDFGFSRPSAAAHDGTRIPKDALRITIPLIECRDAALAECVKYLNQKAAKLAQPEQPFLIEIVDRKLAAQTKVRLVLSNIPLSEAIRYLAETSGMRIKWSAHRAVLE